MATLTLKIKKLNDKAVVPMKMTEGAAGLDITVINHQVLWVGTVVPVQTGIAMSIPKGYHGEVHIRSSYGKRGIRLANCTGIIDSDYRGELILMLINDSNMVQVIDSGERVAQLILVKDPVFKVEEVTELNETERGEGGFGSTNANDEN